MKCVFKAILLAAALASSACSTPGPPATATHAGPPYDLDVGPGVPARDEGLIREGLAAARSYFGDALGAPLVGAVAIRLRADRCFSGSTSTAGATGDTLCINVGAPIWPKLVEGEGSWARALAAHEHVHNLQGQLGCLPRTNREYNWFTEGMAVLVSWEALKAAGLATDSDYAAWRAFAIDNDEELKPLSAYARRVPGDKSYVKSRDAVAALVAQSGGDMTVLTRFCRGAGADWKKAFASAFGETPEAFIVRFEQMQAS